MIWCPISMIWCPECHVLRVENPKDYICNGCRADIILSCLPDAPLEARVMLIFCETWRGVAENYSSKEGQHFRLRDSLGRDLEIWLNDGYLVKDNKIFRYNYRRSGHRLEDPITEHNLVTRLLDYHDLS